MGKIENKEAIEKLKKCIANISLIAKGKAYSPGFNKWQRDTKIAIAYIFGEKAKQLADFNNIQYTLHYIGNDYEESAQYLEGLENARLIIESFIEEIKQYWENEDTDLRLVQETFWNLLHPRVVEIARRRLESKHYADAVEAVLKDINSKVKKIVLDKTGKEYDGSDLMNRAFSIKEPILILDDLGTESGRNIQVGYMQIFAGAMTGIRNPKAHDNIEIDEGRAVHFLFLASLLMHKFDEARTTK